MSYVVKRNGKKQSVNLEKILKFIKSAMFGLNNKYVIPLEIAKKVINGLYPGVSTRSLEQLTIETAASCGSKHPDYLLLAGRLAIKALYKDTPSTFTECSELLYRYHDKVLDRGLPQISKEHYDIIMKNKDRLNAAIDSSRDYYFNIMAYGTLFKSYLLKQHNDEHEGLYPVERPQYMYMRVAIGIHKNDIDSAIQTYNYMSEHYFTHASPTLFNAGTVHPQLSSCFLLTVTDDSIQGIYDTLHRVAMISKTAGGIGLAVSNIRASGSYISGTNGISNGLIPMLRVYNETARYVDQGGGKRKGAFAIYLEPWHNDIFDFLDLKKNHGKEEMRARDLFYAIWMNDLLMQRVKKDEMWSLMCPSMCPGLQEVYAEEFVELYEKYESEGRYIRQVKARELWKLILESQIETGTPYIAYKDSANIKSNQKNLGTLKTSNLCIEILEYVSADEVAVCNLASISLPRFVENKKFNYKKLEQIAYLVTKNLDKVIDVNFYPVESAKFSNLKHRPIGLGTQGLADVFFKLDVNFESEEAKEINIKIFETIYFAALTASNDIAKKNGTYKTYKGSPISKGVLQFDMWNVKPSNNYDWETLRENIKKYGVRNSLLTCSMPTASTATIFNNEASCEAQISNLYVRRVLAGEYIVVNRYLVDDLVRDNLWTPELINEIKLNNGSVQNLNVSDKIKQKYKTVWEISQRSVINLYTQRAPFIDQTQSMNIHLADPNFGTLNTMHFYGWGNGVTKDVQAFNKYEEIQEKIKKASSEEKELLNLELESIKDNLVFGSTPEKALKTGLYYLRTKSAANAIQFTVSQKSKQTRLSTEETRKFSSDIIENDDLADEQLSCSINDPDDCVSCGS